MKELSILFLSMFLFSLVNITDAQNNCSFCKAVEKENFNKVERLFKKQIKKRKHGTKYYNGPGSGMQTTHHYNIDTLTMWLKEKPCVEDAASDKCQAKITIYPGWSVIGAKFKTRNGIVEKCFHIQEGTTGDVKMFGGRFHLFKAKNKLVYKKMFDCKDFVEQQKKICDKENEE